MLGILSAPGVLGAASRFGRVDAGSSSCVGAAELLPAGSFFLFFSGS